MGASWVTAALAVLLAATRQTSCQDGSDFFYTPVESSFAQVQPPLFPNTRQGSYFDRPDGYRNQQSDFVNSPQQQTFTNPGHAGLPIPNYNQNPSPFQLPTGRSQPPGQYYLNQADFTPVQSKSRFRQAPPQNFQFLQPVSTYRPDASQIHSAAYQHDPSRPETFLGQITLNNPDTDFLPSNRFKNSQFDGNSLRNAYNKGTAVDEEAESPNDDLFDNNRVTTYNPNRQSNKQRQTLKQTSDHVNYLSRPSIDESFSNDSHLTDQNFKLKPKDPTLTSHLSSRNNRYNPTTKAPSAHLSFNVKPSRASYSPIRRPAATTEYKALYELEPLLEDDIGENSFRELLKNNQRGSNDVQVIKSKTTKSEELDSDKYDSNPSASSMNADNLTHIIEHESLNVSGYDVIDHSSYVDENSNESNDDVLHETTLTQSNNNTAANINHNSIKNESQSEQPNQNEELEYVEYYDDEPEATGEPIHDANQNSDEEYDTEESIDDTNKETESKPLKQFDIVTLKQNHTMVEDDNFKEFVDSIHMDHTDSVESTEVYTETPLVESDPTTDTPSILRQEVVSVVTTKSVVNGTISVPGVTFSPISTKNLHVKTESSTMSTPKSDIKAPDPTATANTTENWVVVASVQTSRSVSGARFLPFPTVEQEEKKQVLTDSEDEIQNDELGVTKNPRDDTDNKVTNLFSTESINDKLDSIQSELSSSVLSGNFKDNNSNIAVITESLAEKEILTSAAPPLQLFTLKSVTVTSSTEKSAPEPLPVLIKKFTPHQRITTSTTTTKPKRKPTIEVVKVDDISALLPTGYKPIRTSYKDRNKISTTTTTTTTTTEVPLIAASDETANSTQGRSSGITNKNKVVIQDNLSSLLPKDYKPPKEQSKQLDDIIRTFKTDEISKFLPPGFTLNGTAEKSTKPGGSSNVNKPIPVDISDILPKGYRPSMTTTRPKAAGKFVTVPDKVDLSAFLPKGFKLDRAGDNEKDQKEIIKKVQIADLSNLLPPGFNITKVDDTGIPSEPATIDSTTKASSSGFKVVFPSRGGNKPIRKTTSPKPMGAIVPIGAGGPATVIPTIQKGWPVRASTEFTGWPTPSTTPFSIEKLLEAQRNATATSPNVELSTEGTTRRTTTTTTTTVAPPPPTTPGICRQECDIAATIKIVGGVKWVPELLDHHTDEWKELAADVKDELNSVYSKSDILKKWYKGIRIDAFSKGSVLVDYFVELNDIFEKVDTVELKQLFHKSLQQAKPGSVLEEVVLAKEEEPFDPDIMVGDQPEDERMKKSNEKMTKSIDKSAGKLEVGKFIVDPVYTEFIVLPKRHEPAIGKAEEEALLPQWGIAVIVIALASLLFVIIFGVTVLVNRQKSAKAKQPIPLSEDMLRELDKSHMGGYDDLHLKERELPYPPSKRRLSTTIIDQLQYPGAAGDSWRSEWNPQLQQYMAQHYTPDSGRGSQLYGTGGNLNYGYSGSQLYGQTGGGGGGGGGGSQVYGYSGDYPRPQYPRRRSDYDSNF